MPLLLAGALLAAVQVRIDADFPGGSAKVESLDAASGTIRVSPGSDPARGWVCWWYFKVEGIRPGQTLTLDVGGGVWATPDRAAWSVDNRAWRQTGAGTREKKGRIVYRQKVEAKEAWFAWGPPFVLSHAKALVERAAAGPHAEAFELCRSKEGRPVPALRVTEAEGERYGVWVQARQHAWEAGSSWVCRGFVEWLVSDDPRAAALRKRAAVTVVPIMDVDNVEIGAGGKNQKPHDHNRDWDSDAVWPEVRAAMAGILEMKKEGGFDFFLDLHNPGAGDRSPFYFIAPREELSEQGGRNLDRYLAASREEITGPLAYLGKTRESGKNYDKNWKRISKNWVTWNTGTHVVALTLETSWNTPASTAENYRRVGREVGLALERYLRTSPR